MARSRAENKTATGQMTMHRLGLTDLDLPISRLSNVRRTTSFNENSEHLQNNKEQASSNSFLLPKTPVQDRMTLLNEMHEALQECFSHPQKLSKDCFNSKMIDGLSTYADYLVGEVEETGLAKFDYNKMSTLIEGASRLYGCRVEAVYDLTRQTVTTIACGQKDNRTNETEDSPLKRQTIADVKLNESSTLLAEEKISIPEICEENRTLDPHFLKVSSLVDETGVNGLLLTNLELDASMNLIFDGASRAFPPTQASPFLSLTNDAFSEGLLNLAVMKKVLRSEKMMGEVVEICPELRCFEEAYYRKSADLALENEMSEDQPQDALSIFERPAILPSSSEEAMLPSDAEPPLYLENDVLPLPDFVSSEGPMDEQLYAEDNEVHPPLADSKLSVIRMDVTTSRGDIGGGVNPLKALPKRSLVNATMKEKTTSKPSKKNTFFDISCVDVSDLLKPASGFEQMRFSQRRRRRKKTYGFLVADDETTVIFPIKNEALFTLNSHPGKMIQFSRPVNTSPSMDNDLKGTLFDLERKQEGVTVTIVNTQDTFSHQFSLDGLPTYHPLRRSTELQPSFETPTPLDALENDTFDNSWMPLPSPTFSSQFPQPRGATGSFATISSTLSESLVRRFARGNRYIDVSKLKKAISHSVKPTEEECRSRECTQIMPYHAQPANFQHVVDKTMEIMPQADREHCSVHMLFVCLLYVCNDQELLLQRSNEDSGFMIVSDAPLEEHLKDDRTPIPTIVR